MNEYTFYRILLFSWTGLSVGVFALLFFVTAPYGRHVRKGWGLTLPDRWAWCLMETPASVGLLYWFLSGNHSSVSWIFFLAWQVHYLHRAFVYPWVLLRRSGRRMPLPVAGLAFLFNVVNSYLNGRGLFHFMPVRDERWLSDPRFIAGAALFISGSLINRLADRKLHGLRKPAGDTYEIPSGGLFEWICCPNYLGEIIEWAGWAVATWSLPGTAFAVWTAANLVPRARAHHQWYRSRFAGRYPERRRILIPGIW